MADPIFAEDVDPLLGRTIAKKYVVETRLGGGAMGAVYRARQTALNRVVAIKVMHGELATDRAFVERFHREARAASRLTHPHSITVTDFGEDVDGLLYLVMEYVAGPTLEELIELDWPIEETRIVDLMSQILSALAAAHDAGIVHRDLKPANIIVMQRLDDDENPIDVVKVCDFGVASLRDAGDISGIRITKDRQPTVVFERKAEDPERERQAREGRPRDGRRMTLAAKNLTAAGMIVGTPAYMSPEQARGLRPDARSDLYSLGVVLFELLTHRLPFEAETSEALLSQQIGMPAPPPDTFVPCNPVLAYVTLRALEKDPDDRFPSARAMRAELRSILASAEPPTSLRPRRPSGGLKLGTISASSALAEVTAQPASAFETLVARDSVVDGGPTSGLREPSPLATPLPLPSPLPAPVAPPAELPVAEPASVTPAPLPSAAPAPAAAPVTTDARAKTRFAAVAASAVLATLVVGGAAWLRSRPAVSAPPPSATMAREVRPEGAGDMPKYTQTVPGVESPGGARTSPASDGIARTELRPAKPVEVLGAGPTPTLAPLAAPPVATAEATAAPSAALETSPVSSSVPPSNSPVPAASAGAGSPPVAPPEVTKPFAVDGARVRLSVASTSRTSRALVQSLVGRVNVDSCYQNVLRGLGRGEGGSGTASLEIDEDGVVGAVAVRLPSPLAGATACIAARFRGQRISTPPDTGSAGADVALVFEP